MILQILVVQLTLLLSCKVHNDSLYCSVIIIIHVGPVHVDLGSVIVNKSYTRLLIEWVAPWTQPNTSISYYIVTINSNNYSANTSNTSLFVLLGSEVDSNKEIVITIVAYNRAGPGTATTIAANTSAGKYIM